MLLEISTVGENLTSLVVGADFKRLSNIIKNYMFSEIISQAYEYQGGAVANLLKKGLEYTNN